MPPLAVPFAFKNAGLNTPGSRFDADYDAITGWINARNPTVGPIGARPAAGNAGALYIASDEGNSIYVDNGTTWVLLLGGAFLENTEIADPAAPAAGKNRLYVATATGAAFWRQEAENGAKLDLGGVLYREGAGKTVSNTTTETTLFTTPLTIPAGTMDLTLGRGIWFQLATSCLNNVGVARDIVFRMRLGGALGITLGANASNSLPTSASRAGIVIEGEVF